MNIISEALHPSLSSVNTISEKRALPIPIAIFNEIMSYFTYLEVFRYALINRKWKQVSTSTILWASFCRQAFPLAYTKLLKTTPAVNWCVFFADSLKYQKSCLRPIFLESNCKKMVKLTDKRFVSVSEVGIRVWQTTDKRRFDYGSCLELPYANYMRIASIAAINNQKIIWSSSKDFKVRLINVVQTKELRVYSFRQAWTEMLVLKDLVVCLTNFPKTLNIWDLKSGKILPMLSDIANVDSILALNDFQFICSFLEGDISIFDIDLGLKIRTLPLPDGQNWASYGKTKSLTLLSERLLASITLTGVLTVWNVCEGKLLQVIDTQHKAQYISFLNERYLLSRNARSEEIHLWDLLDETEIIWQSRSVFGFGSITMELTALNQQQALSCSHGRLIAWNIWLKGQEGTIEPPKDLGKSGCCLLS